MSSAVLIRSLGHLWQGVLMGLRPTNTNEGASGRCRGINNLDRAFNRAVKGHPPLLFTVVRRAAAK